MLTMLCCPSAELYTMTRTTLRDAALMSLASASAGATNNGDRKRHNAAKYRMKLSIEKNMCITWVPARGVPQMVQAEYWHHRDQG
jgi:hypothetical protein